MSKLISPIFLLLPLLLSLPPSSHSKPCPPCGTTAVPYPLSTSPTCGNPLYAILCTPSTSTLLFPALNSSTYPITSISAATTSLTIQPAPFVPSRCVTTDLHSEGIALNASLPFKVASSNTIMLINCTSRLLLSPLNCSSTSLCHTYIDATTDAAACRPIPICCTFVAGGSSTYYAVRASGVGCSAYRSFVDLDPTAAVAEWGTKAGVELQWDPPQEPICGTQVDCEDGLNATCRSDPVGGGKVKRCFCNTGLRWDSFVGTCVNNVTCLAADGCCGSTNHAPLIAGLVSGFGAALLVGTAGFLFFRRQRRIRKAQERLIKEREDILNANNTSGRSAKNFTSKEIKKATSNFSRENLLGSGGFGDVYKGTLDDGTLVAVKCAKVGNTKSTDQVLNEVRILSQVNHRTLVRLLGCCVDLEQPLMVYEFIANGTLYDHIHGVGRPFLLWRHRLAVAHRTAEGLAYLHFSAAPPIYHRDVKSSNILLDEKLNAKVSDFGLSRLAEADLSHVSTCAQGTLGYLDPEYYRNYQLTDKSDVYSFGVVLLELLTSQKAIDFTGREPDDVNLAVYVQRMVEEERLMEAVDPALLQGATQVELDTMKAVGFLAMGCLEDRRQNRPSMKEVGEEIEYIMGILEADGMERPPSL